jgi:signal recognition particle subunit SRP54
MGGGGAAFSLRAQPPVVVLLAGLQGAGKTTTAAKLARWLIENGRRRVLLASTDVRRPAAMLQLERLAAQVHAEYYSPEAAGATPEAIAHGALARARNGVFDVLIVDTAGRLHVDAELMDEVRRIDTAVGSAERLFVVDAMAGQDAVNAARAFGAALDLTGVILTKADGDARGGAALSVRQVTGKPIAFLGVGEKTDALEPFDPARMASRILGMGDVVSLVEQVHRQVDGEAAARLARRVVQGRGFDMADLRGQLEQLQKMGGVGALIDKLPGAVVKKGAVSAEQGDRDLRRQIAIINSMTPGERRNPGIIDGSRRRRISAGSGAQVQDVNRLLKQFLEMQRVMKSMKGGRLAKLMGAFKAGLPRGFPDS